MEIPGHQLDLQVSSHISATVAMPQKLRDSGRRPQAAASFRVPPEPRLPGPIESCRAAGGFLRELAGS